MKKILLLFTLTLLSFMLIAQDHELTNYEKYRLAQEQELLGVPDTTKTDTIFIEAQQTEAVVINNYYIEDNQPNYRDLFTFGYRVPRVAERG